MDQNESIASQNTPASEPGTTLPVAIVIAGVLIAGSILYTNRDAPTSVAAVKQAQENPTYGTEKIITSSVAPITSADHIRGNASAPVKIIEFSDLECPFCQQFHVTMNQVMDIYGKTGQVAWIYRSFPLDIHPKGTLEAHAAECAAEIGGNDIFWKFIDKIFAVTPANNGLDLSILPTIAKNLGLDVTKWQECQTSNRYGVRIQANISDGLSAGVQGTPYSIVVAPNGTTYPINGARNLTYVQSIINTALKQTAPNK